MAAGDKKFEDLTLPELKVVAQQFAVDLEGKTKKADIIAEITAMGVDWKMYEATLEPVEEEEEELFVDPLTVLEEADEEPAPVEEEPEDSIVVKMIRKNFSYQIRGYVFTRQHPYALVSEEDADYLVEVNGGFRIASPREIREYYGT